MCGLDWATAQSGSIEVANLSLGGPFEDGASDDAACGAVVHDVIHTALCASSASGVTHVVASGNDSEDAATQYPAAYDEALTVTAIADYNGLPGGGAAPIDECVRHLHI